VAVELLLGCDIVDSSVYIYEGPILAVCGQMFIKYWDTVGDPLLFPTLLPIVCRVSFQNSPMKLPLSCEIVEKRRE